MEGRHAIKIGKEFRPSPRLKSLYYAYFLLLLTFGVATWYLPVLATAPFEI